VSAPHHNIEAFMDAGLIPVERNRDFYLSVQLENARWVCGHPPDAGENPPAPLPPEAVARIFLPKGPERSQETTWRLFNSFRQRRVRAVGRGGEREELMTRGDKGMWWGMKNGER
jgi:hypothetical protein